ncbi:MAG TPA: class I SAM-dependent rRNA methyltransferase [Spirochaetia bacterium]|nr:class I SAM-dependent rRNA methyltransferase [Spirochaetia bacterium]
MTRSSVQIKSSAAARIARGGLWVFSNEVREPSQTLDRGQEVELIGPGERPIGVACAEPKSLIAFRLFAPPGQALDGSFFLSRINDALAKRRRLIQGETYRLVFSEADRLPGLIVDRYEQVLAVQLLTWGMERLKGEIVGALKEAVAPEAIVLCNDSEARRELGLPAEDEQLVYSNAVDLRRHVVELAGLSIGIDFMSSQKTGLFLDQAGSYRSVSSYDFDGEKGLDLFCYSGIFGMLALKRGAGHVVFVDSSPSALDLLRDNLRRNTLSEARWEIVHSDVTRYLSGLKSESVDFAFLDPPKFIKSKKYLYQGLQGYFNLNREAVRVLAQGGLLFTFSCSHHAQDEVFRRKVEDAIGKSGRQASLLAHFRQNVDHPVLLPMEESFYLKGYLFRIER